jgi:hypothetical protein
MSSAQSRLTQRQADTRSAFAQTLKAQTQPIYARFAGYTSGGGLVEVEGQQIPVEILCNGRLKVGQLVPLIVSGSKGWITGTGQG